MGHQQTIREPKRDVRSAPGSGRPSHAPSCLLRAEPTLNGALFDHLVGEREQRGWNGETERFRCPHVQHEIEFYRLLDWKISNVDALQDFVNMARCPPIKFVKTWSVRHETASFRQLP